MICSVSECGRTVSSKGYCTMHYVRWRRHGDPTITFKPARGACSVEGCEGSGNRGGGLCQKHASRVAKCGTTDLPVRLAEPDLRCSVDGCDRAVYVKSRGLCQKHYARWHRHGDPTAYVKLIRETCSVDGCAHHGGEGGLCSKHASRVRRYGSTDLPERPARPTVCAVADCDSPIQALGLCDRHYRRQRKTGETSLVRSCRQCGGPIPEPISGDRRKRRAVFCSDVCREHWGYWDRQSSQRARQLKIYGLTVDQYDTMLADQGSACAICRRTEPGSRGWCVDHCHDTGRVRGVLCITCNTGIAHLGHDPDTLRAAIAYLER